VIAAPGSIVVTPPAGAASASGLIVAAPGATVVVQQLPAAAATPTKPTSLAKPNSFSKDDVNTVNRLVTLATQTKKDRPCDPEYSVQVRAGAIDALGAFGGTDDGILQIILAGLKAVLKMEFLDHNMVFRDATGASEFLCYHVVQALEKLGWGARGAIPELQMLRGNDVILDAAIDRALGAIQSAAVPTPAGANNPGGQND
jgi:hypothetical protein